MGIKITATKAAGEVHPNPFVGPINHTVGIQIDVSALTNKEVDENGFLKPGVPFRRNGTLAAAPAGEVEVVITGGAAGAHTVTGIDADDQLLEVLFLAGAGSDVTDASDITSEFTVTDNTITNTGGTNTTGGKLIVKYRDLSAEDYIFGATVGSTQVHTNNTTLASVTTDVEAAVATHGQINRAILEDSLERALTVEELAAFKAPGCTLTLLH